MYYEIIPAMVDLQHYFFTAPNVGSVRDDRNRNIGIGVGVGVGGFLLILVVVIVIAVLIVALRKKNTEKYVLNYSTVYGKCSAMCFLLGNSSQ